jgi:hypothetical protein
MIFTLNHQTQFVIERQMRFYMSKRFDSEENFERFTKKKRGRPKKKEKRKDGGTSLGREDKLVFLKLVSQMAGYSTFERKLNLNRSEVDRYKQSLDVETPDEARLLLKKLEREASAEDEAKLALKVKQTRERERLANLRLDQEEIVKNSTAQPPVKQVDVTALRESESEAQRRLEAELNATVKPDVAWLLPLSGSQSNRELQVDAFRRDIENRGLNFCSNKYEATAAQIKFEANRLGLKINWDRIRR